MPSYIVVVARNDYYRFHLELNKSNYYYEKRLALLKTVDFLGLFANLTSCVILALVMRLLHRMTKSVGVGSDSVKAKYKISFLVTISHICVTLAFTIT